MQQELVILEQIKILSLKASAALQSGQDQEALKYWGAILQIAPNHISTLNDVGKHALKRGEIQGAIVAFKRIVSIDGSDPQQWISLALAHRHQGEENFEELAVQEALKLAPNDLLALIMRADLYERQGNRHDAARFFGAAGKVAPPLDKIHPSLHPSVIHAKQYVDSYDQQHGTYLDQFLDGFYSECSGENLHRFRDAVDIMLGRKKRYDSQSMVFHYPNLLPIEFFERSEFPWLAKIEAGTDRIRDEFLAVLDREEGFIPYLEYPEGLPLNQFAELNNSPDWSAYHLCRNGKLVVENVAQCPHTMSLLSGAPQPIQLDRTPSSMFSLLKPHIRIPAHTGVSNVRLTTHIPLIIPENCGFRVGNQVRSWELGKALIFDDTIEHEAWNNSDKLRVVLIFDIWHPHLSQAEQKMISALSEGMRSFRIDSAN